MTYSKKGTFLKRTTVGTASLLLAGAFLFGGGAVHANQANNGSLARGDDYPYYYKNGSQEIDKWRLYSRQCTSFAAFRLSSVNGFELQLRTGMLRIGVIVLNVKVIVWTRLQQLVRLLGTEAENMATLHGFLMFLVI